MALPVRRLAGLLIIATAFGCPKAVNAPSAVVPDLSTAKFQIGQVIRLDGTGSSDPQGRDLSYAWQFTQIPIGSTTALNDTHSATPSFLADVDGVYGVQLIVSNSLLSSAAASTNITVSKCGGRAPVFGANAITAASKDASNNTITGGFPVGATITLASDVSDPDNSTTDSVCSASQNQAISYLWKLVGQPAASTAALNNPTASSPSFVADVDGTYTVRLVATDSTNRSTPPQDATFTVSKCGENSPVVTQMGPAADSEQPAVGLVVHLSATFTDADRDTTACAAVVSPPQTFAYAWALEQLPVGSRAQLNSTVAQNPSFTPDVDGQYVVRVGVTDSTGRSSAPFRTTLTIPHCGNNAPVAAITDASGNAPPTTGFIGGMVQFGAQVQDADTGAVTIAGHAAPQACSPALAQTFSLRWSIFALPPGSQAQLNNPTGTNPSFIPDVDGDYTVQLVATDSTGLASAPVFQGVHVTKCGKNPPGVSFGAVASTTVNAGTTVSVSANVTNNDASCIPGETYTYNWSLSSKPANSNAFTSAAAPVGNGDTASFVADVPNGTYQVELVVTSSTGVSSAPAFLAVPITTNSCGTNAPTIVAATTGAAPASPNVGFDTVTLTAHGTDLDNGAACSPALAAPQALSFNWSLVSRPAGSGAAVAVATAPADGSVATVKPDVIGPYQFKVVVTDSTGLSSAPTFVTVTTSSCGSNAPKIAGATAASTATTTFTPPVPTRDTVTLDNSGITDADDAGCFGGFQPKTYSWSVVSRPAGSSAVIAANAGAVNAATGKTTATFVPDVPGAYQFRLDVTDSLGLSAEPAFVSVTANSCSLAAPAVDPYTYASGTAAVRTQFGQFAIPAPGVNTVANPNCVATGPSTFQWAIVSAPSGSASTLSNPAVSSPLFTPDAIGDYQFAVVVTNSAHVAAAPVFYNVHANGCSLTGGANALTWSSIAVSQINDPDLGLVTLPATPNVGSQVQVHAVANDPNAAGCNGRAGAIAYQWSIVGAPAGSHATLTSTTDAFPAFVPDIQGRYQLSVVSSDALGNTSGVPDFITIDTSNCGANVPTVSFNNGLGNGLDTSNSGTRVVAANTYDVTKTQFTAVASDADDTACPTRFHLSAGQQYSFNWSISTVPAGGRATLSSATGSGSTFEAFVGGSPLAYQVHVTTSNPKSGKSSDPTLASSFGTINVSSCGSNAPVINKVSTFISGTSNSISRPNVGQSVDLMPFATDADATCSAAFGATVKTYAWTAVSLPSGSIAATTATTTQATPAFTFAPDIAGSFVYSVTATDDTGLTSAPVEVTVNTAACAPSFSGIRVAGSGGYLAVSGANAASSVTGNGLIFDVPPAVNHTGTGAGTVSAGGVPTGAHSFVVKIASATTFQTSIDGGAFGAAVAIAPSVALGNGVNALFSGAFVANDTYAFATSAGAFLVADSCVRQPSFGYAWSLAQKPAASQAALSSLSGANPQLTPDVPGNYDLSLVVTDNAGLASAPAAITLNVASCGQQKPVLPGLLAAPSSPNAGQRVTVSVNGGIANNNSTTCNLSVTPYAYAWSLISIPTGSAAQLSSASAQSPEFVADLPNGTYQVALTVTDALGNVSDPAFLPVTSTACGVNPPVFTAGTGLTAATLAPNANTADALSAVLTDADTGGACGLGTTVSSVAWSVISAPAGSHPVLTSSSTLTSTGGACAAGSFCAANSFRSDVSGTYVVEAVATASNGTTARQTLSLGVTGCGTHAPAITQLATSDSGGSVSRPKVPDTVTITASHTDGNDAAVVNGGCGSTTTEDYAFTLVSAPSGSAASLSQTLATDNHASLNIDVAGDYVVSVTATNAPFGLQSAASTVTIATGVCGPTVTGGGISAIAGPITAGATVSPTLTGAVNSFVCVSGGNAATLAWSLSSKPAGSGAAMANATTATPSFVADAPGLYGIQLVVTDNGGNSTVYSTTANAGACTAGPVIVNKAGQLLSGANMFSATDTQTGPSTTNIFSGDRVQLNLPQVGASVGGFVTGACNASLNYDWSLISRPAGSQATLSSSNASQPAFVADAPGQYQFAVVLRDGLGNPNTVDTGALPQPITPFFFSLTVSDCGSRAPVFPTGTTLVADAAARANLAFNLTLNNAATDPNNDGVCPARFHHGTFHYVYSVLGQPAGAQAAISGDNTTLVQQLFVKQGGTNFSVQAVAVADSGLSSAALLTTPNPFTVSNCGAFPPVANSFSLSQTVDKTGGANPSDTPATGASTTVGGAAASTAGFYLGFPVTIAPNLSDQDHSATCNNLAAQSNTYSWTLVSAPPASKLSLGNVTAGTLVFTPDVFDATNPYVVSLTTTDSSGDSSTSTVAFKAACGGASPSVSAVTANLLGSPASVTVGAAVSLNATVTDLDATATLACVAAENQTPAFQWAFTHVPPGSTATLLAANTQNPSFVPDVGTDEYDLSVTVTDPQGHTGSGSMVVKAACGGVAPSVAPIGLVAGAKPDFTVSQALTLNGGALSTTLVHASDHTKDSAAANLLYPNIPAQLSAVVLGAPGGTPITTACGPLFATSISYQWSIVVQPPGSTATINNPTAASPSFTPDLPGVYDFSLKVTDQNGRSSVNLLSLDDRATIGDGTVNHPGDVGPCGTRAPTVAMQTAGNGPVGARTLLDATGSQSPDDFRSLVSNVQQLFPAGCGLDELVSYNWSLTSVPVASTAAIDSPTLVDPSFVPDKAGAYTIQLTVSDGRNHTTRTAAFNATSVSAGPFSTSSTVFTATTFDPANGAPIVAWWDNANGSVGASRCTAGCNTATPTYTALPAIDSGLTPMVFGFNEEPRPIAIGATSATNIYVAYYTGRAASGPAGQHSLTACGLALATYNGTTWSYASVANFFGQTGSNACSTSSLPPYSFFELGRWVSMAMNAGIPTIAFWDVMGPTQTEPELTSCTTAACTAFNTPVKIEASPGANGLLGKWVSAAMDGATVQAAYYVDNDGSGNKGLRYANNSTSAFVVNPVEPLSAAVDVGRFASIAVVPNTVTNGLTNKNLAIAYANTTTGGAGFAKLAKCDTVATPCTGAGAWGTPAQITDALTTNYGRDTQIAVDGTGLPRVAYLDIQNGEARLLTGGAAAPFTLTRVTDLAATSSPTGLSLGFSTGTTPQVFMGFASFSGVQVFGQ